MTQIMDAPDTLPSRSNGTGVQKLNPKVTGKDTATLKAYLESSRDRVVAVIPKHLNADKLLRVALVAVSKSELLQECTVSSILQCVMTGAQLGLDVSGVLGSAYMVPFYNGQKRQREAVFIPGYRGLIDLARRSGEIEDIYAHCVYSHDQFNVELGAEPKLQHKPNLTVERKDEDIVGAYMVAFLRGNTRPHIEFVPRTDIEKVRASSKAAFDKEGNPKGPWKEWFSEMCRKTAIRRGIKYLPMSIDLAEALSAEDEIYKRGDEVLSASTGPAKSTTGALVDKLTNRPTSEQTFVPAQEFVNHETGEVTEVDTASVDAEPFQESAPDVSNWESTVNACECAAQDAGMSPEAFSKALSGWTVVKGAKGAEEKKTTPAMRLELVLAIREKRIDENGRIWKAK